MEKERYSIIRWAPAERFLPTKSGYYMVQMKSTGLMFYTTYNSDLNLFNADEDAQYKKDYMWEPEEIAYWAEIPKPQFATDFE